MEEEYTVCLQNRTTAQLGIGIPNLSPIPKQSGAGLGLFVPIPECFRHRYYYSFWCRNESPLFRYLNGSVRVQSSSDGFSVAQQGAEQFSRVKRSSVGYSVAQYSVAQEVQRSSVQCSIAQKGAAQLCRMQRGSVVETQLTKVQPSVRDAVYLSRVLGSSERSAQRS